MIAYLEFPEADILIHCGDATIRSSLPELRNFARWIESQPHKHKLFVPGNHDWMLTNPIAKEMISTLFKSTKVLLCEALTIEGLNICGIALDYDMRNIPTDLDILITHYPPNGILDEVPPHTKFNNTSYSEYIGSNIVLQNVLRAKPRIHLFGHVHEQGGRIKVFGETTFYNCALLDQNYKLVGSPIMLDIEKKQ